MHLTATVDLRPIGSVELTGLRVGDDFRWLAYVATTAQLGQYGAARVGDEAWTVAPGTELAASAPAEVAGRPVDAQALETALTPGNRATAEDHGIEVIEGARARRCRIAVDGPTFRARVPADRWLVGDADLHRWRGQLDYWIFLDGQLGQVAGSAQRRGDRASAGRACSGTIDVRLTATERGHDPVIYPPAP